MYRLFTTLFLVLASSPVLAGNEWPQFRGPTGDGHAEGSNLPDTWSESENIVWKTELLGRGWSSPVVADGIAWMTSATVEPIHDAEKERIQREKLAGNPIAGQMEIVGPAKMFVASVDVDSGKLGKVIPLFAIAEPDPIHNLNSYASPSPILHQGRLYCHFGKYGTACIDTKTGHVVWRKQQYAIDHSVGAGSSPVLYGGVVILPCDGTDLQYVVGLDATNGEQLWRTDRPKMSGNIGDLHKAFATPFVTTHNGKDQVIVPGAQWFVSYDPRTGHELWRFRHGDGFSNVPRPVVSDGVAYLCTGFMTPEVCAVRIDGEGEVTQSHQVWRHKRQVPTMSSPILVGGELYFVSDQGVLTCLDAARGDQLWQKRLKGNFSSSPLYADGKLYFCSREGETSVLRPGRKYDEVAVNTIPGQWMASPVVIGDALLLRSDSHLYRIAKTK
jgi:outer membrane protein assembly factor BamB